MKIMIVFFIASLAFCVSAQSSTVDLDITADGSSQGTITISDVSIDPCSLNTLVLPSSVEEGLSLGSSISTVIMSLEYTHEINPGQSIGESITKTITLMNDDDAASNSIDVTFFATDGIALSTTLQFDDEVSVFNSIQMSEPVGTQESCSDDALSAVGITGHAAVEFDAVISIGDGKGDTVVDEIVEVWVAGDGFENGFEDLSWSQHFTYTDEHIEWMPCEYKGIALYNTNFKYPIEHVKNINIRMQADDDIVLEVWLHNNGDDESKFRTKVEFAVGGSDITIPVGMSDSSDQFDQIRITETTGVLCSEENLPDVFIEYVALIGDGELTSSRVDPNNPDDSDDGDGTSSASIISVVTAFVVTIAAFIL